MPLKNKLAMLLMLFCSSAEAGSNDFFGDMLAPGDRAFSRVRYELRAYGRETAGGEPFGLLQNRFDASVPLYSGEKHSWRGRIFADYDAIESKARFSTGRPMPNRLWDTGLGASYSRKLEEARNLNVGLTLSSASDRPFSRGRDLGYSLNLTYKIPMEKDSAWFIFLNSSNTRGFLSYIPLPGFAYYFRANETLRMVVGLPFAMLFWTPTDLWSVTASYFPLRNAELRVTYGIARGVQPYALASYRGQNFRLSDRADEDERLHSEEGLALAGVGIPLRAGFLLDLSGGLSFARRYYISTKSNDRSSAPTIKAQNALLGALKLAASL